MVSGLVPPAWARDNQELLAALSHRYIWWATPEEMLQFPERIIVQVMNLGSFKDVESVSSVLGDKVMTNLLVHAEAGQFTPRSWHYWHYRLGLAEDGPVPPLPLKHIPAA